MARMDHAARKSEPGTDHTMTGSVQAGEAAVRPAVVPTIRARILVAIAIATAAASLTYIEHLRMPGHPADFGIVWFGARALLHGANPYGLVGPSLVYDWEWRELYPATAMVAAMPLAILPQLAAAVTFVWISSALLAYAITVDGWYRLPLFLSSAFIFAARSGQWSPLMTAALCIPSLAWVFAAKPNFALALIVSTRSKRAIMIAIGGGAVLLLISLFLLPRWPALWISTLRTAHHISAPIVRLGGVFILLALLRWRRAEARLIVALACMPQTTHWYDSLPLLLVPATFRQSLILSFVSSAGFLFERFIVAGQKEIPFNHDVGALMVALMYLPATIMVLRRPNVSESSLPQVELGFSRPSSEAPSDLAR
jgi:hypothetical protein